MLMYEIWSLGCEPFENKSNDEVRKIKIILKLRSHHFSALN